MHAEARLGGAPTVAGARLARHSGRPSGAPLSTSRAPVSHAFLRKRQVQFSRAVTTQAVFTKELEPKLKKIADQGFQLPEFSRPDVEKSMAELKAAMGECSATDMELEWFIRDRGLDVAEAQEKLQGYLDWRSGGFSGLTADQPEVAREITLKKAYLSEDPDVLGRPIVIVKAKLQVTDTRDLEATKKLCVWLMDTALEKLEGTDHENILVIFDLRGFGPKNADIPFLKFFIDVMFKYYPKRIANVLLVEPPFVFQPVWQILKPLLGKYSSLVRFSNLKELKEYIGKDDLPEP
eukprot:CAMPEP_0118934338 /NCGR_PEP_ID=MMETSP1169-20130426/13769_1 /TAXON_ID=36882 /ORGANISM="Pyramimonas obovata, Strain CCMP722" /LENGTH=292 /DNA_ID=CAMNT_0006877233 /DNA_START=52 /DNA_END=930 /DNA_ORIENTATION=-